MTESSQYGVIKAIPLLQVTDLFKVPHRVGVDLTTKLPAFGSASYQANLAKMQEHYFHSDALPNVTFREPTTSGSISACAYDFTAYAKPKILVPSWLQLGRIVRTSEVVFINPPRDAEGNPITDERVLKAFLTVDKRTNGIYLLGNDFVGVPYETFKNEVQDSETFSRSGLARGLEYTTETEATKLKAISSKENYPKGVNVWGFDPVSEPALRVAGLCSGRGIEGDRLSVLGSDWIGNYGGYAFGML